MYSNQFEPGQILVEDIYDEYGILLLPAGARVTERFIRRVKFRNIRMTRPDKTSSGSRVRKTQSAKVQLPEPPPTETAEQLDQLLDDVGLPAAPQAKQIITNKLQLHHLRNQVEVGRDCYNAAVEQYANATEDIMRGKALHLGPASVMLNQLYATTATDPSMAMLVMDLKSTSGEYLYRHGMNVAMLSMRVAMQMNYDRDQVLEAGLAALFADLGMLSVPSDIRMAPRALTESEQYEMQRHPVYTVDRLERSQGIAPMGLLIAFQTHERADRSGYPRKRGSQFIHPLAQVIAAADTYCAVTCDRPYREKRSPHTGISTLLREVQNGKLDKKTVRVMLDCLSLFPIGSFVHLANGTNARVLRANHGKPQQPVVVPLNADGSETDEEIALALPGTPQITAALGDDEIAFAA